MQGSDVKENDHPEHTDQALLLNDKKKQKKSKKRRQENEGDEPSKKYVNKRLI